MTEMRKTQTLNDVIVGIPMVLVDGTQATNLTVTSFTVGVTRHDATVITNCTPPTITNPVSKGEYLLTFPSAANSPAFTLVNEPNPYTVILDHPETDVEPMSIDVWITDRYGWDLALNSAITSLGAEVSSTQTEVTSIASQVTSTLFIAVSSIQATTIVDVTGITETKPRIEVGDTFQFKQNFGSVPTSVGINVIAPDRTVVASATATQSGDSANFFYFYTTVSSFGYTTVDSSGIFVFEWTAHRTAPNSVDIIREEFEVIRTRVN